MPRPDGLATTSEILARADAKQATLDALAVEVAELRALALRAATPGMILTFAGAAPLGLDGVQRKPDGSWRAVPSGDLVRARQVLEWLARGDVSVARVTGGG